MNSKHHRSRHDAARDDSSEEWGRRLRSGDSAAVDVVRQRVHRILSNRRLRIPAQERDDLAQEVMTELWRAVNRTGFDFTAGFWGFVEVVTSRRCIDWLRARRIHEPLPEDLEEASMNPFDRAVEAERTASVSRVVQALEPGCRELITRRMFEGASFREIAQQTGKSEVALRVQLYRCIRSARNLLDELLREAKRESDRPTGSTSQGR